MAETEFEYVADRGMVRVRIVPEGGRLTAVVSPMGNSDAAPVAAAGASGVPAPAAQRAAGAGGAGGTAVTPVLPPPAPPVGDRRLTDGRASCTNGRGARGPARGLRRSPVPGGRARARRAAQRAGAVELVRPAPARGRAARVPHPRRDAAPVRAAAQRRAAGADAAGGDARAQPRRMEGNGRLGLRL